MAKQMWLSQAIAGSALVSVLLAQSIGTALAVPSAEQQIVAQLIFLDTVTGELDEGDQTLDDGRYITGHPLELTAGNVLTVEITSQDFDPTIIVGSPDNDILAIADGASSTTAVQLTVEIPEDGTYWFVVSSTNPGTTGQYTFNLYSGTPPAKPI
ncbi:MAG: hypothetical protein ACFB5Z_08965 [Elainellaceae cyanobacterium]